MNADDPALASLRRNLERTEADLRRLGYATERCVAPPGATISNQLFEGEILILVLFGCLWTQSNEQTVELGPGDRLHVPSGVPFALRVIGETSVYWLQAIRPDPEAAEAGKPPAD